MIRKRRDRDEPAEQPDASLDDLLQQPPPSPDDTIPIQLGLGDPVPYADAAQADAAQASGEAASGGDLPPIGAGSGSGDDFLDDDDLLPQERRGPSKLTVSLVTVLVLAVGALGGIWIQKQFGAQSSAAAAGFPSGGFPGGGQGMPSGGGQGFPGGGQGFPSGGLPGSGSGGMPSGATDTGNGSENSSTQSETPVVVGAVTKIESDHVVVKDLGGKSHDVTVTTSTTVTVPFEHGELKTGDTVSITGSTSGQKITASTITVR